MTQYENILINIFANAAMKIVGAIDLHVSGYSCNLAYFASIIAQEELAKLVILPIANELGDLNDVISNRNSDYFKHGVKQKLFTSFGLQNRTHDDVERIKQECLYVGVDKDLTPVLRQISKQESLEEIKHATLLLTRMFRIHCFGQEFSDDFKRGVHHFMGLVKECVLEKLPEIDSLITEEGERLQKKSPEEMKDYLFKDWLRNPYELISMFKAVFKENYKQKLSEARNMSLDEFEIWLANTKA